MCVVATPLMGIKNIIRVTQRGPTTPPIFDDITTDEQLCDLLMGTSRMVMIRK